MGDIGSLANAIAPMRSRYSYGEGEIAEHENQARWVKLNAALYRTMENNPVVMVDPNGLDVWIEGSCGDEPIPHQSINVGDPNGEYYSQSFGLDSGIMGDVYEDEEKGGKIIKYAKTTPEQDETIKRQLQDDLGGGARACYGPTTCRTYSQDKFDEIKAGYGLKESTPPARAKPKRTPFRKLTSSCASPSTTTSSSDSGSSR